MRISEGDGDACDYFHRTDARAFARVRLGARVQGLRPAKQADDAGRAFDVAAEGGDQFLACQARCQRGRIQVSGH